MDIGSTIAKKQQQIEQAEALIASLRDEVETLLKARAIIEREGDQPSPVVHHAAAEIGTAADVKATGAARSLINTIREIVRDLPEPFTTGQVKDKLQALDPEWFATLHYSSISGTMRRLAEADQLAVVEKGGPGKEATYRLPSSNVQQEEEIS